MIRMDVLPHWSRENSQKQKNFMTLVMQPKFEKVSDQGNERSWWEVLCCILKMYQRFPSYRCASGGSQSIPSSSHWWSSILFWWQSITELLSSLNVKEKNELECVNINEDDDTNHQSDDQSHETQLPTNGTPFGECVHSSVEPEKLMLLKMIFDDYAKLAAHFRNDINTQVIDAGNNSTVLPRAEATLVPKQPNRIPFYYCFLSCFYRATTVLLYVSVVLLGFILSEISCFGTSFLWLIPFRSVASTRGSTV